ncbi:hypothetical protein LG298_07485 [Cytobacillus firmus]|uniref:hypothetical protein n=1 Tax=Cytobacillus firmus TaxID=1399 RepID=UPI00384F15F6
MPAFAKLPKELQRKVRDLEFKANELGKEHPETRKLWLELRKDEVICGALNQKDGVFSACVRSPVEKDEDGSFNGRCGLHGGKSLKGEEQTENQKRARQHLKPDAHFIHGLYASDSSFINSLTEQEIAFMEWLEGTIRSKYVVEEGLGDIILEGLLIDAVLHFRMVNKGTFEKGSKHTVKPLQEIMKTVKEMGWTAKTSAEKQKESTSQALADLMAFAKDYKEDEEDKTPQIKRIK